MSSPIPDSGSSPKGYDKKDLWIDTDHHILSIQSHVARDYVGNRACALTLQLLGHEVDVINTVNFSSMYVHQGNLLSAKDFGFIMNGLEKVMENPKGSGKVGASVAELAQLSRHDIPIIMSGYIGGSLLLSDLESFVSKLKMVPCTSPMTARLARIIPNMKGSCLWVMDPVMGDNDSLYVSPDMPATYKKVVEMADVITPNEYELRWLIEKPTHFVDEADVMYSIRQAHALGPTVVFLTSVALQGVKSTTLLSVLSVRRANGSFAVHTCRIPKRDVYMGGCGDCVSALFVDRMLIAAMRDEAEPWGFLMSDVLSTLQRMLDMAVEKGWPSINVVKCRALLPSNEKIDNLHVKRLSL